MQFLNLLTRQVSAHPAQTFGEFDDFVGFAGQAKKINKMSQTRFFLWRNFNGRSD